jgi:hypothetical protein
VTKLEAEAFAAHEGLVHFSASSKVPLDHDKSGVLDLFDKLAIAVIEEDRRHRGEHEISTEPTPAAIDLATAPSKPSSGCC